MQKDLSDYRKSYEKSELNESSIDENPLQQFQKWFYEVEATDGLEEPNAMTVSTIGTDGFPKNRVVLMKKFTYEGFIFYTNYKSEKGRAIEKNPSICLSFFWPNLERQVIVKGKAERVAKNLSDGYFESRPKGSQLGAVVSEQSETVESRDILEMRLKKLEEDYEGKAVNRPEHWGGYLVRPISIEFWQGRPNRLHDRIRYTLLDDLNWKIERLQP
ncbi:MULTISPECIES: pyridoxamine 5'-phosphate oxidase [unclassified Croceitalea]|uniref:pyridoxamine 5'-phosphate oxidase n=1 Tax=unclassified Croceitalea TaxID=2632280 RepID=UPI0030D9656E